MKPWMHALVYQATWFFAVLGGNALALFWALPLVLLLWWQTPTTGRWFIVLSALAGYGLDLSLQGLGLIDFNASTILGPLWLLVLWTGFAGVIWHLLHRVPYLWLRVLCGAASGPFSYASGAALGAAAPLPPAGLLAYAGLWALLFPLLVHLRHRLTPRPVYLSGALPAIGSNFP